MVRWLCFGLVFAAAPAVASPLSLSSQGRILDVNGDPIEGDIALTFSLYADGTTPSAEWSQTQTVPVSGGFYTVILAGFDVADLDGQAWLGVTMGNTPVQERQPLHAAPYAVVAGAVADNTEVCDASTVSLHGSLRYHNGAFEGCSPDGWSSLGGGANGSSPGTAAQSCLSLHTSNPSFPSGTYWIAPQTIAVQTWCDMTPGDAGWTLIAHKSSNGSDIQSDDARGVVGEPGVGTSHFKIHTDRIDELQALSTVWRVWGSVTGKETDIATTGLPGSGMSNNEYRQLRSLLTARGVSGCGADRWVVGEMYPVDGSIPTSCYAYPTTANFYDYKSNSSGGNGQGQTLWLR